MTAEGASGRAIDEQLLPNHEYSQLEGVKSSAMSGEDDGRPWNSKRNQMALLASLGS